MREKKNREQSKNTKVEEREKSDKFGTKEGLEKIQNFGHNGARENRPMTPTKRALRAAL
jgi:hypothetical protein